MSHRSLTRTGLVLLGVYFALTGPVTTLATMVGIGVSVRDEQATWMLGGWQLASTIPLLLSTATPGVVLIALSRPLSARLCPAEDDEGSDSPSRDELARLGLTLLALYFALEGLAALMYVGLLCPLGADVLQPSPIMVRAFANVLVGGLLLLLVPRLVRTLHRS